MNYRMIFFLCGVMFLIFLSWYLPEIISFKIIQQHKFFLQTFVHEHYYVSLVSFFLGTTLCTALALPVTALLMLFAGFLFGAVVGGLLFMVAATLGSVIVFLGVRYLMHDYMLRLYQEKFKIVDKHIQAHGAYCFLAVRFAAIVPFYLENIIAGLTTLPLSVFIWTTVVGIIPMSFIYTYAGTQLRDMNGINDIFTTPMMICFLLLALLVLIPVFIKILSKNREIGSIDSR